MFSSDRHKQQEKGNKTVLPTTHTNNTISIHRNAFAPKIKAPTNLTAEPHSVHPSRAPVMNTSLDALLTAWRKQRNIYLSFLSAGP